MAKPSTRQGLIDYCLRKLGHPVIQINVDEDQIEDRVDDAIQFFQEYHFDGIEKVFLRYQITQADINNGYISLTYQAAQTSPFIDAPGTSGQSSGRMEMNEVGEEGNYVNIEDLITSVINVWHFGEGSINMFDVRYQYALNDLYSFGIIDLTNYTVLQQHLSLLRQLLSPEKSVRFSRRGNKLYIDMDWRNLVRPGHWVIIEAYRVMDPRVFPEIYNDMTLKKYVTAQIKQQWASNLLKYQGVALPGAITLNASEMWAQSTKEIEDIETTMQARFEIPPYFTVG